MFTADTTIIFHDQTNEELTRMLEKCLIKLLSWFKPNGLAIYSYKSQNVQIKIKQNREIGHSSLSFDNHIINTVVEFHPPPNFWQY